MIIRKKKSIRKAGIKKKVKSILSSKISEKKKIYVIDTSAIINKFLGKLLKKGLKGKLIIPNAVMAELENLANKGKEEGFIGLEEIAKLHKLKDKYEITISFEGNRPNEHQIKFAKSGEIDAMIKDLARKKRAVLITADLVQAVSAKAYNLDVLFLKVRKKDSDEKMGIKDIIKKKWKRRTKKKLKR